VCGRRVVDVVPTSTTASRRAFRRAERLTRLLRRACTPRNGARCEDLADVCAGPLFEMREASAAGSRPAYVTRMLCVVTGRLWRRLGTLLETQPGPRAPACTTSGTRSSRSPSSMA
jgi:hypothetical protein